MWDLKICRACLATNVKMFHVQKYNFQVSYEALSGLKLSGVEGMPLNVCVECASLLKKYTTFRKKCRRAHFTLLQILDAEIELSEESVKDVDRKAVNLISPIAPCNFPQSVITVSDSTSHVGKRISKPPSGIYNISSVHIPSKSNSSQDSSKGVKRKENYSYNGKYLPKHLSDMYNIKSVDVTPETNSLQVDDEVKETENRGTAESLDEVPRISISIENGEIVLAPRAVDNPPVVVEDEVYCIDDSSLDNEDFQLTEDNSEIYDREVNLSTLISPNALPQTVIITADSEHHSEETFKPQTDRRLNDESEMIEEGNEAQTIDIVDEPVQISFRIENGAIVVVPSGVGMSLKAKDCNNECLEKFRGDNYSFDDGEFRLIEACGSCNLYTDTSAMRINEVTTCASVETDPDENANVTNANRAVTVENENVKSAIEEKSQTSKKTVRGQMKGRNYDVVSLSPTEQRAEMEKRKMLSSYLLANFKCDLCYRGFRTEKPFLTHLQKHDEALSGPFECKLCHLRFIDQKGLFTHHYSNHSRKFICRLCNITCSNRCQASYHSAWHRGVKFTCRHCGEIFSKRTSHLNHLRIKHPSEFKCSLCSNTFVSEAGVTVHQRLVHKDSVLFQKSEPQEMVDSESYCAMCGVQFESVPVYTKHVLTAPGHCTSTIINSCATCGKTFSSKLLLTQHRRQHRRPFKCMRMRWPVSKKRQEWRAQLAKKRLPQ